MGDASVVAHLVAPGSGPGDTALEGPRGRDPRRAAGPRSEDPPGNAPRSPPPSSWSARVVSRRKASARGGFDPGRVSSNSAWSTGEQAILVQDGGDGVDPSDTVEFLCRIRQPWTGPTSTGCWRRRPGMRIEGPGRDVPSPPAPSFLHGEPERTVQILELPGPETRVFFGAIVTTEPVPSTDVDERRLQAGRGHAGPRPGWPDARTGSRAAERHESVRSEFGVGALGPGAGGPVPWFRERQRRDAGGPGGDEDVSLADYVRITYPHLYALDDGALR
jgi:hypothetical protein